MSRSFAPLCCLMAGAVLLLALEGCKEGAEEIRVLPTGSFSPPDSTIVTITGDAIPLNIDPDPVYVDRGWLIEWSHSGVDSFEIDLRRVPMLPVLIKGRPGVNARAVVPPNAPHDTFKYSITVYVDTVGRTQDPRVICCGSAPGGGG